MFRTEHSKILKLIAKDNQIPNKWTEYKILGLKYGNTKYHQVKWVFVLKFICSICIKVSFCFCFFVSS